MEPADSTASELPGVPLLTIVDAARPGLGAAERAGLVADFRALHRSHFPDFGHVVGEVDAFLAGEWDDPQVVPHLWLLREGEVSIGYVLPYTNTRRGVVLVHFVAVAAQYRAGLPHGWLQHLADAWEAMGSVDCAQAGTALIGLAGEVPKAAVGMWRPCGFEPVPVAYWEVRHGSHWRDHGEPEFFPMTLVVRVAAGGVPLSRAQVEDAAVRAFSVDHYLLPAEHPVVAGMLRRP